MHQRGLTHVSTNMPPKGISPFAPPAGDSSGTIIFGNFSADKRNLYKAHLSKASKGYAKSVHTRFRTDEEIRPDEDRWDFTDTMNENVTIMDVTAQDDQQAGFDNEWRLLRTYTPTKKLEEVFQGFFGKDKFARVPHEVPFPEWKIIETFLVLGLPIGQPINVLQGGYVGNIRISEARLKAWLRQHLHVSYFATTLMSEYLCRPGMAKWAETFTVRYKNSD